MTKTKIQDVAKSLNVKVDEVVDLLAKRNETAQVKTDLKKKTILLENAELDYIFAHYTKTKSVANFNDYFAMTEKIVIKEEKEEAKPVKEKKAPKAKTEKKEEASKEEKNINTKTEDKKPLESKPKAQKPTTNAPKAETKPAAKPAQNAAKQEPKQQPAKQNKPVAQNAQTNANKQQKPAQNNNGAKQPFKQNNNQTFNKPAQNNNNAKPVAQKPVAQNKPVQKQVVEQTAPVVTSENTKQGVRIIDTRTSNVNIDKYNERYDKMANDRVKTENVVTKQKLNQRSRYDKSRRGKKETEQERLKRIELERAKKPLHLTLPEEMTVGELALALKATAAEVIKKLMMMGSFLTVNDTIDFDTAELVAMEFNAKVEKEVIVTIEERIIDDSEDDDDNLITRAPVVVVMGHVDHGKTSLLDAIRNANVTDGEAGGITQHIGAYRTKVGNDDITFLDTPGHAAFTTMRARGAMVTDIAILVVAADDGIMPQTIEAINHAKAANVSIIVAINKMDKPAANPDKILQQLTEYDLVPEEWGGETPCIPVSAVTKSGIKELLEMVMLVAEMKELKANPERAAKGTVIEARLDKGRGPIATVLIQNGTLHIGDIIVAGNTVGRVRAMTNHLGQAVTEAGPSIPVEITGLDEVPTGGDIFNVVSDERLARELVDNRKNEQKEELFKAQTKVTLDNLFDQMKDGDVKELKIIVKADVQGSVEAVKQSLLKLSNEEVRVNIIHGAVGAISESDVMLASASNAIIVGFNVRPDPVAETNAERDGVDMRMYRIIYQCIEEMQSAMKGMLDPKYREVTLGRAEVRQVYKVTGVGTIAGSYILDGKINRTALLRIVREGIIVADDKIVSLRRFKDDVKEVNQGYECGIGIEKFTDLKEGDIFECYEMEEYRD